jgi:MoaA/NifB/PqqE/SkfB family radical SAM enzyme
VTDIASADKVAFHKDKIEAYLRGERIYPATLELDITSACDRNCPDCPSSRSPASHSLGLDFIDRLFSFLQGHTRGLLLTGGEPTLACRLLPQVLRLARERGFLDLAIVTNGARLSVPSISQALLEYASTIRVSMYDWNAEACEPMQPTLGKIEALRQQIDHTGSALQIGVSALTSSRNASFLATLARETASAGAHWLYFHPTCTRWDRGSPTQVDQTGVLGEIEKLRNCRTNGFQVFALPDRYGDRRLHFSEYHAAHFILTIGADGLNYLAPEVKYQPQHVVADVAGRWQDEFLWAPRRLNRIRSVTSETYPALGSRHRGMLYSDLIERLIQSRDRGLLAAVSVDQEAFLFPHIL